MAGTYVLAMFHLDRYVISIMDILSGNTIIFTDLHAGLSNNKVSRLAICEKVIEEILTSAKENNVHNFLFGGDWYHSRTMLDLNTINVSLKLVSKLADQGEVYLIVGNHDAYLKNSNDINSLNMFRDNPHVHVIDSARCIMLNGQSCLLVPWLTDMTKFKPESYDLMIGHFEVSSKYLIQSYVEEHSASAKATSKSIVSISSDDLLKTSDSSKASSLIGEFVDVVKPGGTIYSGHIHNHRESVVRHRKFIFVGSPYQQNLGDAGDARGFYVLDSSNKHKFIEINSVPKHVKVLMHEAIATRYDFSQVKGNIIQKVYDIDVKQSDDVKISQKINDYGPYEELLPDYKVSIDFGADGVKTSSSESLELIQKSKLDYMKNYVDNIDGDALADQGLDREKLFKVLEAYYKRVVGEAGEQS